MGFQTVTRLDSNVVVGLQQCCALEVNLIFSFVFVCCTPLKVLFDDRLDSMPSMAISKNLDHAPDKLCRFDDHKLVADRLAVAEALPVAASEG